MRRTITNLALLALLVGWWFTFGPVALGGPATFAVVEGRSMEPTHRNGDLVVARSQQNYAIGDVVVFPLTNGKAVIHRIVAGSAEQGWTTRGDNNDTDDRWTLLDAGILGEQWFDIPRVGSLLMWTQRSPWLFAVGVGLAVLLASVFGRRFSRLHPLLADALRTGRRVSHLADRPLHEVLLFRVAGLTAVSGVISLVLLWSVGIVRSAPGVIAVMILAAGGLVSHLMARRLVHGHGLMEPRHSRTVLSEYCWEVTDLPEPDQVHDHQSPHELRSFLRKSRLPVLRRSNEDGTDIYLTVRADAVGHRWKALPPQS
jgi:signal peptidase I